MGRGGKHDSMVLIRAGRATRRAFVAGSLPEPLRASGLTDASALRGALVGRIDLLLPDVRR